MWWRTRHGRGPPARHHLLEQLPGPAEHPCRVPLAAAHTPGTAPFSRPGLNTHERSGEEPFKRSREAQNPRSHTAPASLQRSRTQTTMRSGSVRVAVKVARNAAAVAPSSTRWSIESVTLIVVPGTTAPSRTTGSALAAPTARMAASGGLITAVKWSTPNMPRLLTVKVPPVNSSGVSLPARAFPASDRHEDQRERPGSQGVRDG